MKVALYKDAKDGEIRAFDIDRKQSLPKNWIFYGYEERNIEFPNKLVTKEVKMIPLFPERGMSNLWENVEKIPPNAINPRIVFEVVEEQC